jgi:hypothetical protein
MGWSGVSQRDIIARQTLEPPIGRLQRTIGIRFCTSVRVLSRNRDRWRRAKCGYCPPISGSGRLRSKLNRTSAAKR